MQSNAKDATVNALLKLRSLEDLEEGTGSSVPVPLVVLPSIRTSLSSEVKILIVMLWGVSVYYTFLACME